MNAISVIVRYHGAGNEMLLHEALFSLCLQLRVRVQPVIVLHNCRRSTEESIRATIEKLPADWAKPDRYKIVNVHEKSVHRGALLNKGVAEADERFLAFLDYDDVMYHDAYSYLIERLKKTKTALAAGGCKLSYSHKAKDGHYYPVAKMPHRNKKISILDFVYDNHLPIHSFVLDRTRIAARDLVFNTDIPTLEDYDFLLRLISRYPVDLSGTDQLVCEYRARLDGTNTTPFHKQEEIERFTKWRVGRAHIRELKKRLRFTMTFHDLERHVSVTPG